MIKEGGDLSTGTNWRSKKVIYPSLATLLLAVLILSLTFADWTIYDKPIHVSTAEFVSFINKEPKNDKNADLSIVDINKALRSGKEAFFDDEWSAYWLLESKTYIDVVNNDHATDIRIETFKFDGEKATQSFGYGASVLLGLEWQHYYLANGIEISIIGENEREEEVNNEKIKRMVSMADFLTREKVSDGMIETVDKSMPAISGDYDLPNLVSMTANIDFEFTKTISKKEDKVIYEAKVNLRGHDGAGLNTSFDVPMTIKWTFNKARKFLRFDLSIKDYPEGAEIEEGKPPFLTNVDYSIIPLTHNVEMGTPFA